MNPLQIEDRGLLIPPEYLAGLARQMKTLFSSKFQRIRKSQIISI